MAGLRINIMELRQIIRLKKEGISNRKVADMLHLSRNTVNDYVRIFETHKLDYNDLSELDNAALMVLFPYKSNSKLTSYAAYSGDIGDRIIHYAPKCNLFIILFG